VHHADVRGRSAKTGNSQLQEQSYKLAQMLYGRVTFADGQDYSFLAVTSRLGTMFGIYVGIAGSIQRP
jgi:hypothetical protein